MLNFFKILPILFLLISCKSGNTATGSGYIVITKEATDANNKKTKDDQKTGEACAKNIFGLIAIGDASIKKAKANSGITSITSIEKNVKAWNIYIPFGESCTVIRGY